MCGPLSHACKLLGVHSHGMKFLFAVLSCFGIHSHFHPLGFFLQAFEVDEDTQEFRILHPNMEKRKTSLLSEHFDLVSEGEGENEEDVKGDADTGDSSSDEDERVFSKHSRKQEQLKARKEDRKKGKAAGPR